MKARVELGFSLFLGGALIAGQASPLSVTFSVPAITTQGAAPWWFYRSRTTALDTRRRLRGAHLRTFLCVLKSSLNLAGMMLSGKPKK